MQLSIHLSLKCYLVITACFSEKKFLRVNNKPICNAVQVFHIGTRINKKLLHSGHVSH